jgi:hypothetical protein
VGAALQTTLHVFVRLVVRSSTIALTSQKSESAAYFIPRFLTRIKNVILLQLDGESVRNLLAPCSVRGSALGALKPAKGHLSTIRSWKGRNPETILILVVNSINAHPDDVLFYLGSMPCKL